MAYSRAKRSKAKKRGGTPSKPGTISGVPDTDHLVTHEIDAQTRQTANRRAKCAGLMHAL